MMKKLVLPILIILAGLIYTFLPKSQNPPTKLIAGGIVPHHLLADFLIDDFFSRLKPQNPETIILIGPNHDEKGAKALSAEIDWETDYGLLKRDEELINKLKKKGLLNFDEKILKEEPSISNIIPFIKKHLPSVKIMPLILRANLSLNELEVIAKMLAEELNEKIVIVASIDFSHYLSRQEAQAKDEETIKAIKDFDLGKIYSFGNDHLDSASSLIVILLSLKEKGKTNPEILRHSNSGIITKKNLPPTTSYFSIAFK